MKLKLNCLFLFFPLLIFSQAKKTSSKKSFFKSTFYVNASSVYRPYQTKGFYRQNVIKSLGVSLEGGVYLTFWNFIYFQTGLSATHYRSYNFRDQGKVYHQVVPQANELSVPYVLGFVFYDDIAIAVGFKKIMALNEFYTYRIFENGELVYYDKSKYLNFPKFINQSSFVYTDFYGFIRMEARIKENYYVRIDQRIFSKYAIFIGLTYKFP